MVNNVGLSLIKYCGKFIKSSPLAKSQGAINFASKESKALSTCVRQNFNNVGARLVEARKGVPISELDKAIVPNAVTTDFVTVQSGFGTKTTDIVSYRDKDGNLIKRFFTTKENGSDVVRRVEADYSIDRGIGYFTSNRKHFIGDKLIKSEEILLGTRRIFKDTISFFDRAIRRTFSQHGIGGKFIEISALRQTDGLVGNKICSTVKSNCLSTKELNALKKLSYLHEFQLHGNDFLEAIIPGTVKSKNFRILSERPMIQVGKLDSNTMGTAKGTDVIIDLKQHHGNSDIVETLNHELQHVKQLEMQSVLFAEKILNKLGLHKQWEKHIQKFGGFSKTKRKFAGKCEIASRNYVAPEKSFSEYYNNFKEIDARKFGEAAKHEYKRQEEIFNNIWYAERF